MVRISLLLLTLFSLCIIPSTSKPSQAEQAEQAMKDPGTLFRLLPKEMGEELLKFHSSDELAQALSEAFKRPISPNYTLLDLQATINKLLKSGASLNVKDKFGRTALMNAIESLDPRLDPRIKVNLVKNLLERGADPNILMWKTGTLLDHLRSKGVDETDPLVKLLREKGAKTFSELTGRELEKAERPVIYTKPLAEEAAKKREEIFGD